MRVVLSDDDVPDVVPIAPSSTGHIPLVSTPSVFVSVSSALTVAPVAVNIGVAPVFVADVAASSGASATASCDVAPVNVALVAASCVVAPVAAPIEVAPVTASCDAAPVTAPTATSSALLPSIPEPPSSRRYLSHFLRLLFWPLIRLFLQSFLVSLYDIFAVGWLAATPNIWTSKIALLLERLSLNV